MKHYIKSLSLACLLACGVASGLNAADQKSAHLHQTPELNWMTNYEQAKALAKKESKPLFLYFTGSDWCPWCMKMDREILSTTAFQKNIGDSVIFVKVDFPQKKQLDPATKAQNSALQKEFKVHGFPTVILLDSSLNLISKMGYEDGGGQLYAAKVQKAIADYSKK